MIDQHISQFMNREVLQGEATTPLSDVIERMNSRSQSAFVVCENGRPIGVISERDTISVLDAAFHGREFDGATAADVMTAPVHTLAENATMGDLISVLKRYDFRRVPIVDDKGELSGIVNLGDVQDALNRALERRGRDLEIAVMKRTAALQAAHDRLEEISIRDGLTDLLNRRAMAEKLTELHALARRYGNPYSVLLTDIDHFKLYNDNLGHLKGDEALVAIAQTLQAAVRESDAVYRYGGEEFLVAMPETDADGAVLVAERMRQMLAERAIPHPSSPTSNHVTLSIGVSTVTHANAGSFGSWNEVVDEADRCLYAAKEGGRDRIVRSDESD